MTYINFHQISSIYSKNRTVLVLKWRNLTKIGFRLINHLIMHGNGWKFQKTCIFTQIFQQNRKKWIFWKIDVFSKVLVFWNGRRIKILHFWTFFDETLGDCSKILYYNLRKFRPKKSKNEEFLCVARFNRSTILPQKRHKEKSLKGKIFWFWTK